jgi:hypothetical protein
MTGGLFLPRPSRDFLRTSPLHVVVRDFPETLEDIRAWGVTPAEMGAHTAEDVDPAGGLLAELEAATAWRPGPAEA